METVFRFETALTVADHAALSRLLAAAYPEHGERFATHSWPLGYGRPEARLWLADPPGDPVAHLLAERRIVGTPGGDLTLVGVGGVAVAPHRQRSGLGLELMARLRPLLRAELAADFAFLQCREEVVPFYRRAGWTLVANRVRNLEIADERTVAEGYWPTLVMAGRRSLRRWPKGLIDLRGVPW
jgi:predicted N-acetyltransferase YhbS